MTRSIRNSVGFALATIATAPFVGCEDSGEPAGSEAAARGRAVYMNVCIACHHGDPNEDGVLGPAIAGSSVELLEARVLRAEYPEGYEPKRPGIVMPKFEYLEDKIPDLAVFLAEVERP